MHSQYITNEMVLQTNIPNLLRIVCLGKKNVKKKFIMKEGKRKNFTNRI